MIPFKIGLVLGGGGARGLAHVGVIEELEHADIPIHIIGGSSIGALIGGIYAQHPDASILHDKVYRFIKGPKFKNLGVNNFRQKENKDPDDILSQMAQRVKRRIVINLAARRIALLKFERLQLAVEELIDNNNIEDCQLPFACTAADLISGEEVVFRKGNIRTAIGSSSAIPGFLPPVKYNGKLLIDGSVVNNFPINSVKEMGANITIAVNVSLQFEENNSIDNVVDIVMRAGQITGKKLNDLLKKQADVIISPDTGNIHWSEFNRIDELIEKGKNAAREKIPDIKKIIKKKTNLFYRLFNKEKINKS